MWWQQADKYHSFSSWIPSDTRHQQPLHKSTVVAKKKKKNTESSQLLWSTLAKSHCYQQTHRSRLSTASEGNNRRLIVTVAGMWNATMSASGEWVTSKHWTCSLCVSKCLYRWSSDTTLPPWFTLWNHAIVKNQHQINRLRVQWHRLVAKWKHVSLFLSMKPLWKYFWLTTKQSIYFKYI